MTTQRTVLVIPGSGGCWHVPHQLFAADAARMRGAQMHYVSWSGEVPPEPEARGPWAVEQITAALRGLPKPLIIAYSLGTLAADLAADYELPAIWIRRCCAVQRWLTAFAGPARPAFSLAARRTPAGVRISLASCHRMCLK